MAQADVVKALRAAGIPMGGRRFGHQCGWTTSRETADKALKLGATLHAYTSSDPRYSGWEMDVPPDPPEDEDAA